jgi:hypothetical protein
VTLATGNVMQTLEDRTEKSRREMDLHDTIDTVRVLNARNQHVDIDKVGSSCAASCAADDPPDPPRPPCVHPAAQVIAARRSHDTLANLECSR